MSQLSLDSKYPPPPLITQADCIEWLSKMGPETAHLVITDPAYESLEKHRAIGTTTRLTSAWFPIFRNDRFPELFRQLYRVLKPNAHLYMFVDSTTMFLVKPIGEAAGFKFWKPLVFDKVHMGMGYHYRGRVEFIMFFEKGHRGLKDLGVTDLLQAPRIRGGYPTEKPSVISETLIDQSSAEGELVIDPFMGSASVGAAALRLKRKFAGCDVADESIRIAMQRLLEQP